MEDFILENIKHHCKLKGWDIEGILPTPSGVNQWDIQVYFNSGVELNDAQKGIKNYLDGEGINSNVVTFSRDKIIDLRNYLISKSGDLYIVSIFFKVAERLNDFSIPYNSNQMGNIIKIALKGILTWNTLIPEPYRRIANKRIPGNIFAKARKELPKIISENITKIKLTII